MRHISAAQLERAVVAICPEVAARTRIPETWEGQDAWHHLSICILSSQVPFETAFAAADALRQAGLLRGRYDPDLNSAMGQILASPVVVDGRIRHYRFPMSRGRQLAATCKAITEEGGLDKLLASCRSARDARQWFVRRAPGLGPKQASMFLRNIGFSYDLAILDRHVLEYMAAVGLCEDSKKSIPCLRSYEALENSLRAHAHGLGYNVGLVDRAIWVVMRVARRRACEEDPL